MVMHFLRHHQHHIDTMGASLVALSVGGAGMAWVSDIDVGMRILASIAAVCSGVAATFHYGKQNGWWK